ncbi:MAG: DNA translocase FtsK 4TM domain-containing protein, partial [Aureliella sp.]
MNEPRKVKFDVEATVLAGICVLLWASLLSYDAADPVGPLLPPFDRLYQPADSVYPLNAQTQNWCGWWGALVAQMLVEGLGIGAIPLVAAMSVLTLWMFRVQDNFVAPARQFGWLLVIVALTTLASLLGIHTPHSPAIGPGGYLGAITTTWLNEHFALIGGVILSLAVLVAGLLLSTDYVVLRWFFLLLSGIAEFVAATVTAVRRALASLNPLIITLPRLRTSDVDSGVVLAGAATGGAPVSVRIRGQQIDGGAAAPSAAQPAKTSKAASQSPAAQSSAAAAAAVPTAVAGPTAAVNKVSESLIAGVTAATSLIAGKLKPDAVSSDAADDGDFEPAEEEAVAALADAGPSDAAAGDEVDDSGDGPRLRRKKKPAPPPKAEDDSLEHLDDTSLPEGTEEYVLPGVDLLTESDDIDFEEQAVEVRRKAKILEKTFGDFGFNVRVVEIETGPVIAQYEVELEAGLR